MFTNKSKGIKDRNLQVPDCLEVSKCHFYAFVSECVYIYSAPVFVYITLKTLVPFMTLKFIWRPGKVTDRLKIKKIFICRVGFFKIDVPFIYSPF